MLKKKKKRIIVYIPFCLYGMVILSNNNSKSNGYIIICLNSGPVIYVVSKIKYVRYFAKKNKGPR